MIQVAHIVADRLFQSGVLPVATAFDGPDLSMNAQVRAAAGHPVKANKLPLWIPEYRSMISVDVSTTIMEPRSRQRIDSALAATPAKATGKIIPDHTISSRPLRSLMGIRGARVAQIMIKQEWCK